jgi:hypothetical protein
MCVYLWIHPPTKTHIHTHTPAQWGRQSFTTAEDEKLKRLLDTGYYDVNKSDGDLEVNGE